MNHSPSFMLPTVALIGRPNVGKSSLFNALSGQNHAIVADQEGTTHDRIFAETLFLNKPCLLVDTGGLAPEEDSMSAAIHQQVELAIEQADVIVFVLDAKAGLTPEDQRISDYLRKQSVPVILAINKMDHQSAATHLTEFYTLGWKEIFPISAQRRSGFQEMIQKISVFLPEAEIADVLDPTQEKAVWVSIIGRPNVGKSTLINRLLGENRTIVSDTPGTTRDAVIVPFYYKDTQFKLIDTAGIRRKRAVDRGFEQLSVVKSLQMITRADMVIFLLDSQEGITDQDLRLLSLIKQAGKALVVGFNKWDLLTELHKKTLQHFLENKLKFIDYASTFFISAEKGMGISALLKELRALATSSTAELKTSELTRLLEKAIALHAPPMVKGRRIKLRYAHSGGLKPPTIIIHGNQTESLPTAYRRYLIHFFMKELCIHGVPLRLIFKTGENPYIEGASKK